VIPLPFALGTLFVWRDAYTTPFTPNSDIGFYSLFRGRFHGLFGLGDGVGTVLAFSKA
jgi:hypothetical protein